MANQPTDEVKIEVIQGGLLPAEKCFAPIPFERTSVTGLKHVDGAISMARSAPDSATSSFFICVGDQPELDFGGKRNKDGQGFAAFGKVVYGMDKVKKIQQSPGEGQILSPPVKIISVGRPTGPDRVAVQHVLIAFKGSIPEEKVRRSQEEAHALALEIFERAKKGEDFDSLVKNYTNDEYPGIYRMANFGLELLKEKKEYSRAGMVWSFGEVSFGLPVGGIGLAVYDPKAPNTAGTSSSVWNKTRSTSILRSRRAENRTGKSSGRDRGRRARGFECRKNFPFNQEWNGRAYLFKQVRPIFVEDENEIVVVTVYVYYY
jgi:cyclophilin family peptidyl-prolyl cis-trans isomerase